MSATYISVDDVKANLGITDAADDVVLGRCAEAASRAVDSWCGRVFYDTTETRYFTAEFADLMFVDDLLSVSSLQTDEDGDRTYERTWATTDYDLEPFNKTPKTKIRTTPQGSYTFPPDTKAVKITGTWGYCTAATVPPDVAEATMILAVRLFKRKDAPFGIFGTAEIGVARMLATDPDMRMMLEPFRRQEIL